MTREEGLGVAVLLFVIGALLLVIKTIVWLQLS